MWHFGKDRKFEYKNGFSLTWGYGREVLRTYTKSINRQKQLRKGKQESPNKPNEEVFREKLNETDDKSDTKERNEK